MNKIISQGHHVGFESLPSRPWRVKLGMDPTAPDLHLGHGVLLRVLRQLQDDGHQGVLVVGSFTAQIGDPTGKNAARPALSAQQVLENAKTYVEQAFKILDPTKTQVVYNNDWLGKMTAVEMTKLLSKVTLAQLLERDDFSNRLKEQLPLGMHEMLYPLLQAMDSVHLQCDVELGGSDQWFNLHMGRALQEKFGQPAQAVLAMPLLVGLDGVQKMSKSLNNHIGLAMDPVESFGRWMSVSDATMWKMLPLLNIWDSDLIEAQAQACSDALKNPMTVKMKAGQDLLTLLHGAKEAQRAVDCFVTRHQAKKGILDAVTLTVAPGTVLPAVLKSLGFAQSNADAIRKMSQGGVRIDGVKVFDKLTTLKEGTFRLEVGKRQGCELIVYMDAPEKHSDGTQEPSLEM